MRAFLFREAASRDFDVRVLLVPAAGYSGEPLGDSAAILPLPGRSEPRAMVPELLADPRWRDRIAAAYPLPARARVAPVTLAAAAVGALGVAPGTPVHATRSYLAPLGVAVAEQLGSPWATLDLDEDDEWLVRSLGDDAEADAYHRLVRVFGPFFQAVALAAPAEAAVMARGHGLAATVIPNAVALPGPAAPGQRPGWPARDRPEGISVLFVGNLTYPPNVTAAVTLVRDVLPRLRQLVSRPVSVTLVGETGPGDGIRSLGAVPGVEVAGFVADLAGRYRAADVVVAPLAAGGGTRIKLLEALAHGLPVVTSSAGAAGLDLADGEHALITDGPDATARAVAALAADPGRRERLAAQGYALVSRCYSDDVVIPRIRGFFAAAGRSQLAPRDGRIPAPPVTGGPDARFLAVRGSFRGASGHDRHTRGFVRELARQGVRLELTDLPHWHPVKLPATDQDPWFDELSGPVPASAVLQFCMPHQVVASPPCLVVNYTMFEASPAPADWVARGRAHDLVIVPTESSLQAWLEGGFPPGKLRVCPLGVDAERFHPGAEPLPLTAPDGRPVADYRVRMLNVSEPRARKNLTGLVRAWIGATSADDDAILIIKMGPSGREAAIALFRELALMEQALGKSHAQAAPILFVDRLLADAAMPGLFAAASHYCSMSRGEGWDQPMIEAAASGLRLIAPRHSAYLSYLDDDVAQLVPARRGPADAGADPWTAPLFDGAQWWEPDADAARQALRNAIDGRDRPAASARDGVAAAFTWRQATARLIEILADLHREHGRPF